MVIVKRRLVELARSSLEDSANAELCLRCYISNQIRSACDRLATQFGEGHDFRARDLWRFVLDDLPPHLRGVPLLTDYQSIADRILDTFDPELGSLNTWIDRLVKRQEDLKQFLLERGVYLATDWAILNNATISKLEDVLSDFYNRTPVEIRQACQLLRGFHAVYSRDRLQDRMKGKGRGKCHPPTTEQLQRIAQFIQNEGNTTFPSETEDDLRQLKNALKEIATDLRGHHIYMRTGNLPPSSMVDNSMLGNLPDDRSSDGDDGDEETQAFLTQYRHELLECLEEAIAQVIESRVRGFRKQKSKKDPHKGQRKADNFLEAMQLNLCEGLSMEEIALKLGLKDQPTVSKLLKLKAFRADVRHHTLRLLRDRVIELASRYLDRDRLQNLDRRLDEVLGEQLDEMVGSTKNILTDRVCRYLNRR